MEMPREVVDCTYTATAMDTVVVVCDGDSTEDMEETEAEYAY